MACCTLIFFLCAFYNVSTILLRPPALFGEFAQKKRMIVKPLRVVLMRLLSLQSLQTLLLLVFSTKVSILKQAFHSFLFYFVPVSILLSFRTVKSCIAHNFMVLFTRIKSALLATMTGCHHDTMTGSVWTLKFQSVMRDSFSMAGFT